MATFTPAFTLTKNAGCLGVTFTETTGSTANGFTEGYGAGTVPLANVTSAKLEITNESTNVTYDDITITAADTATETNILATALLVDGVSAGLTLFTDGIWSFKYKLQTSSGNYNVRHTILIDCTAICSLLDKMAKVLDSNQCCITEKQRKSVMDVFVSYFLIEQSAPLGYINDVTEALTVLQNTLKAM